METDNPHAGTTVPPQQADEPRRVSPSAADDIDGRIEGLVGEISRIIRMAPSERRAELKEFAEALLHDEITSLVETSTQFESPPRRYNSNPLLAGLLLMLVGLGFLVIFPLVGLSLGCIGVVLTVWGVFITWFRKR